jgi:phospholipid/cholesterol/gamma-HCH transport system substrate-binding protein
MTRKLPELVTGFAVILIAALFLVYALGRADTLTTGGYPLSAQFSSIGGLTTGSDVKVGGVVVGHVTDEHLDPQTYAAIVKLDIDGNIKLPADTSAAITSDGLLGGDYVSLSPGGSDTMLAPGQSFQVTQSAINIEDLLGKFIFSMGDMNGKSGGGQGSGEGSGQGGSQSGATGGSQPSNPAALPNPAAGTSLPK